MQRNRISERFTVSMLGAGCLLIGLLGCRTVGPSLLRNGRGVYNDAITTTTDQQVLKMIVRGRYAQSTGILRVASVTSNLRIAARASADFAIGSDENYAGNLVPLQAGAVYEENPTISYIPVQGEQYLSRLLSPLPLGNTLLLVNGAENPGLALTLLIKGINGIRNPAFLRETDQPDPRFERIGQLITTFLRSGCMAGVGQLDDDDEAHLFFSDYQPHHEEEVRELFSLLGLDLPEPFGSDLVVPVILSVGRAPDAVRIETRSLYDLLLVAEAAVEVPEEDLTEGAAKAFPPAGAVGKGIRIQRAPNAPENAAVAVEYDGWSYFIAGTDLRSKRYFRTLEVLLTVLMTDNTNQAAAPVLTVPVSR